MLSVLLSYAPPALFSDMGNDRNNNKGMCDGRDHALQGAPYTRVRSSVKLLHVYIKVAPHMIGWNQLKDDVEIKI